MIYYDSHIHTSFSTDSTTPMENMIEQGIQNKLSGITFTDHIDYGFPQKYNKDPSADSPPFLLDVESYINTIQKLKEKYRHMISLYTGVEIGLKKDVHEKNALLSSHPSLDYRIGSIHLIDDMDPYDSQYWESVGSEVLAIERYFETTRDNLLDLNDIQIDTLGHMDYIVRYAPSGTRFYSYYKFADIIDEILRLLIDREISLEINTAGYKNGGNMPNPNADVIRRYKDLGGKWITFGSDAHTPDRLGKHFQAAGQIAWDAGFRNYITFVDKKPLWHNL